MELVWVVYMTDLQLKAGVFQKAPPGTNRLSGAAYQGLATSQIIAVIDPAVQTQSVFVSNEEITFSR